jgi:hypothetical protein
MCVWIEKERKRKSVWVFIVKLKKLSHFSLRSKTLTVALKWQIVDSGFLFVQQTVEAAEREIDFC